MQVNPPVPRQKMDCLLMVGSGHPSKEKPENEGILQTASERTRTPRSVTACRFLHTDSPFFDLASPAARHAPATYLLHRHREADRFGIVLERGGSDEWGYAVRHRAKE